MLLETLLTKTFFMEDFFLLELKLFLVKLLVLFLVKLLVLVLLLFRLLVDFSEKKVKLSSERVKEKRIK